MSAGDVSPAIAIRCKASPTRCRREAGLASVELFSASLAAERLPRGSIRVCIGLRGLCSLVSIELGD